MSISLTDTMRQVADNLDIDVREYSGRGMNGRTCFAITGSHATCITALQEAIKIAAQEMFDIARSNRCLIFHFGR